MEGDVDEKHQLMPELTIDLLPNQGFEDMEPGFFSTEYPLVN